MKFITCWAARSKLPLRLQKLENNVHDMAGLTTFLRSTVTIVGRLSPNLADPQMMQPTITHLACRFTFALLTIVASISSVSLAAPPDANRLTYLDEFCDPYWPNIKMAKLITPQWVGDDGVECVVTIGIDLV